MAEIDYFQATIDVEEYELIDAIADAFNGTKQHKKGFLGYENTTDVKVEDKNGTNHIYIYHGGNNGASPNVKTSGAFSGVFRAFIQSAYPDHRPTRVDSAIDLFSADYDALYEKIHPIANKRRVRECMVGDWNTLGSPSGRTVYWGSTKSTAMVRLYEKGKEQRAEMEKLGVTSLAKGIPLNWVRLEAQIRPSKNQKKKAAIASPDEIFGFASFVADIYQLITNEEVGIVPILPNKPNDIDKTIMIMTKQYKRALTAKSKQLGGFEKLGLHLKELISDDV